MLRVVATGAYYPPVATTRSIFAQNGEIRVWELQKLISLLFAYTRTCWDKSFWKSNDNLILVWACSISSNTYWTTGTLCSCDLKIIFQSRKLDFLLSFIGTQNCAGSFDFSEGQSRDCRQDYLYLWERQRQGKKVQQGLRNTHRPSPARQGAGGCEWIREEFNFVASLKSGYIAVCRTDATYVVILVKKFKSDCKIEWLQDCTRMSAFLFWSLCAGRWLYQF